MNHNGSNNVSLNQSQQRVQDYLDSLLREPEEGLDSMFAHDLGPGGKVDIEEVLESPPPSGEVVASAEAGSVGEGGGTSFYSMCDDDDDEYDPAASLDCCESELADSLAAADSDTDQVKSVASDSTEGSGSAAEADAAQSAEPESDPEPVVVAVAEVDDSEQAESAAPLDEAHLELADADESAVEADIAQSTEPEGDSEPAEVAVVEVAVAEVNDAEQAESAAPLDEAHLELADADESAVEADIAQVTEPEGDSEPAEVAVAEVDDAEQAESAAPLGEAPLELADADESAVEAGIAQSTEPEGDSEPAEVAVAEVDDAEQAESAAPLGEAPLELADADESAVEADIAQSTEPEGDFEPAEVAVAEVDDAEQAESVAPLGEAPLELADADESAVEADIAQSTEPESDPEPVVVDVLEPELAGTVEPDTFVEESDDVELELAGGLSSILDSGNNTCGLADSDAEGSIDKQDEQAGDEVVEKLTDPLELDALSEPPEQVGIEQVEVTVTSEPDGGCEQLAADCTVPDDIEAMATLSGAAGDVSEEAADIPGEADFSLPDERVEGMTDLADIAHEAESEGDAGTSDIALTEQCHEDVTNVTDDCSAEVDDISVMPDDNPAAGNKVVLDNQNIEDNAPAITAELPVGSAPSWVDQELNCVVIQVHGINIAIPMDQIESATALENVSLSIDVENDWILGQILSGDHTITYVLDSACWLMPELYDPVKADYKDLLMLQGGYWGIACDEMVRSVRIPVDKVSWAVNRSKRPWLLGTYMKERCAILDVDALIDQLNAAF